MTLTVPALGVHGAPVFDSDSPQALDRGVAHVPETSMPWDPGAQRNVYLAAHRLGYEGPAADCSSTSSIAWAGGTRWSWRGAG